MDFNAKRLALLAGVGNPDDRHVIVQEQAQQLNESIEARQASSDEEEVRKAVRRTIQKMIAEGVLDEGEGYGITGGAMHVFEDEEADDEEMSDEEKAERAAARKKAQAIVRNNPVTKALKTALPENDASLMRLQKLAGLQILSEGYSDDELRELCHSKDHNCAVVVDHPEWGRGKPIYESHALPDDEGNVEWYDVQFKHGIEKKVMAEDVTILEMEEHSSAPSPMEEDELEEDHCFSEDEDHMEEGELEEEMVYGAGSPDLDGPPASDYMSEEEDQEEGMIYELEEELEEITLYEQEDGQLHTTIDGVEYALVKK